MAPCLPSPQVPVLDVLSVELQDGPSAASPEMWVSDQWGGGRGFMSHEALPTGPAGGQGCGLGCGQGCVGRGGGSGSGARGSVQVERVRVRGRGKGRGGE